MTEHVKALKAIAACHRVPWHQGQHRPIQALKWIQIFALYCGRARLLRGPKVFETALCTRVSLSPHMTGTLFANPIPTLLRMMSIPVQGVRWKKVLSANAYSQNLWDISFWVEPEQNDCQQIWLLSSFTLSIVWARLIYIISFVLGADSARSHNIYRNLSAS